VILDHKQTIARGGKLFQQLPLQGAMIEFSGNLARIRTRQGIVIGTDFINWNGFY
jgi:hypothetical protein